MNKIPNSILKQLLLLSMILLVFLLLGYYLNYFIPGVLGAITMYILYRDIHFYLVHKKGWKSSLSSLAILLVSIVIIVVPLWIVIAILLPQIEMLVGNKEMIAEKFRAIKMFLESNPYTKKINIDEESLIQYAKNIAAYIPQVLNSTLGLFTNIATAFFLLYFMQTQSEDFEKGVQTFFPFNARSKSEIWMETRKMIVSNAIGIPTLGILQGLLAVIGYWIFGIEEFVLWGFLTGIASFIPLVGTMIIWMPLVILLFAQGATFNAIGLAIYSAVVIGMSDNVIRFTLLKKIGDVHPIITVFGVIVGLSLFGAMGIIFGPLLFSYFLLLVKIYKREYATNLPTNTLPTNDKEQTTAVDK